MSINDIREIYRKNSNNNVRNIIEKLFLPTNIEKLENAEVSTPVFLIDEMLSKIPEAFWKTPKKVLEPCCGKGNFLLAIFDKFYEGLEESISDKNQRCKTIVAECIFFGDITENNVLITIEILRCHIESYTGIYPDYTFNLFVGNTLLLDVKEHFKIDVFDAVVGNPPYQSNNGTNGTLWDKFVIHALTMLKENGYMSFVNPSGWRNSAGKFKKVQKEILTRDLRYLEIHDMKDGLKTFNCATRYDWYLLKNKMVNETNTIIKFQDGEVLTINVVGLEFIPNGKYEKITSMIAKKCDESVDVLHSESKYIIRKKYMSNIKDYNYKYPCVYTINTKSQITCKYSSEQHGHFGVAKLIWSNGSILSVGSYLDDTGIYGLTQFAYAIIDESKNLENIKKAFDSKEFRELMTFCAVGQSTINHKAISLFKKDFWKEFI